MFDHAEEFWKVSIRAQPLLRWKTNKRKNKTEFLQTSAIFKILLSPISPNPIVRTGKPHISRVLLTCYYFLGRMPSAMSAHGILHMYSRLCSSIFPPRLPCPSYTRQECSLMSSTTAIKQSPSNTLTLLATIFHSYVYNVIRLKLKDATLLLMLFIPYRLMANFPIESSAAFRYP